MDGNCTSSSSSRRRPRDEEEERESWSKVEGASMFLGEKEKKKEALLAFGICLCFVCVSGQACASYIQSCQAHDSAGVGVRKCTLHRQVRQLCP
jgi:hypothetical protein